MFRKLCIVLALLLPVALLSVAVSAGQGMAYSEAPALAEMVTNGDLPPVEERLPANPLVVEPIEEVGVYGGTWLTFGDNISRLSNLVIWQDIGLLMWNNDQNATVPSLAESWEISDDSQAFTIKLREGLRWSDGAPMTADDIMFWYEDVISNDELRPVKPGFMRTPNGHVGAVEKLDDLTVVFNFPEPHGMFLTLLTKEFHTYLPAHYMKQFHKSHVSAEALQAAIDDAGVSNWVDLFYLRWNTSGGGNSRGMNNPDLPTMLAWTPTVEPPGDRFVFERNPYFFAVDTDGNQLPYIDRVDFRVVDGEVMKLRILAGEPNFQAARALTFSDMALYVENAEANEYEILRWGDLQISEAALWINLNTPDPVDRELYQDVRFRRAMSLAINRERVNDTLYFGQGQATAATLPPVESRYYKEEYARAYTDYDPDQANALLDEIGLTERDGDGFRLKPDGNRLSIVIEVPNNRLPMIDNLNLIRDDYADVGVDFIIRPIDNALWGQRMRAGEMQFVGWPMAKAATETDLVPISTNTDWAPLWGLWYHTNGEQGEEPPDYIKDLQNVWTRILETADQEERDALYDTILRTQAENMWVIGVVGPLPKPVIRKTWFRNVKTDCTWSYHHGGFIGCTDPFAFWIEADHQ